jgi:hypothetical protein
MEAVVEFRSEAQLLAVKKAFLRITSDESWAVMRQLAEETIYQLEQKSLNEDDEDKARAYRYDARGARKFWQQWLRVIDLIKNDQEVKQEFIEVAID